MGAFDLISDDSPILTSRKERINCDNCRHRNKEVYCIQFKRKGDRKNVFTAVIISENSDQAIDHFFNVYIPNAGLDIDKRTIKWSISSLSVGRAHNDGIISFVTSGEIKGVLITSY